VLIYDCEIKKGILGKNDKPVDGVEYCAGWRDFENMGVSCIGAYDYTSDRYRVFMDDNLQEFAKLTDRARVVVGFNSNSFDDQLLAANGIHVKSYDLLAEIWEGAGLGREFQYPSHVGYGLDACVSINFGTNKTGHGAQAPVDYQQGRIGAVIDYCLNDVRETKRLLDRVIQDGFIINPKNVKEIIRVKKP